MKNKENKDIVKKIEEVLDTIRPYLMMDGGNLDFIKYEDGYAYVKLKGACEHCAFSNETIETFVFETLKNEIPEVKGVINVTL